MSNLNVENLGRYIQIGDGEKLIRETSTSLVDPKNNPNEVPGTTFSDILRNSVEKVNELQTQANTSIHELVAGRTKNIHETLLTIERADNSLKLMMQVRNKILDAYREIMRMQV